MNPMTSIPRLFMLVGGMILAVGLVMSVGGRYLHLGRLPGDISFQRANVHIYIPLGTSLMISLVLSLVLWILSRGR